jgi:hypothetical protein
VSLSGLASLAPGVIAVQAAVLVSFLAALWAESEFLIKNRAMRGMVLLSLMVMPVFRDSFLKAGMIDLVCTSLLVIGSLILLRGLHKRGGPDLWVGAFLVGCAMTVKYMALIGAAYWVLYVLALVATRAAPKLPSLVGAALLACVVPAYWYVRNALVVHNPIYPLLSGTGPESLIQLDNFLPHTWWAKVLYPVLVYMPYLFGKGMGYSIFAESVVPLAAVLGTAILLYLNRRLDKSIVALWGFALFYSYAVSYIADDVRFDLPALVVFAVLDGILLEQLLSRAPAWAPRALAYAASVAFIVLTPFMLSTYGPRIAVLEGRMSPQTFIFEQSAHKRSIEDYDALVLLRHM